MWGSVLVYGCFISLFLVSLCLEQLCQETFNNMLERYRWALLGAGVLILGAATYIYYTYDPAAHSWFPRCPFNALTGLDCPGCGSHLAVHAILHGDFRDAFCYNALLLPFITYLILCF